MEEVGTRYLQRPAQRDMTLRHYKQTQCPRAHGHFYTEYSIGRSVVAVLVLAKQNAC